MRNTNSAARRELRLPYAAVLRAILALWAAAASVLAEGRMLRASHLPRVAPSLGRMPTNCPIANPQLVHGDRPPSSGIWIGTGALVGYSLWDVENHRLKLTFGTRTIYGYAQKIFWERTSGAAAHVSLYGWNLRTKQRVWFGNPLPEAHPKPLIPLPVVAWPSGLVRNHIVHNASAPTLTFVPSSGCYVIKAAWQGSGWSAAFGAGQ